jgi:GNAT superfamily N-acetyltransferase
VLHAVRDLAGEPDFMRPIYSIVCARAHDIAHFAPIELAAATLLKGFAPEAVLAETTSEQDLKAAQQEGRLWSAIADERPVGFAHAELMAPDHAHLKEVDVHPDHGRRRLGTRLVLTACQWAARLGCVEITLTTFRELRFNMPFYAGLGFEPIAINTMSPALLNILEDETRRGLDLAQRVVMRRQLCS